MSKIILKTTDGVEIEVDKDLMVENSNTLKLQFDDAKEMGADISDEKIEVMVSSDILKIIIKYYETKPEEEGEEDDFFSTIDKNSLLYLISAGNYLDMKKVLDAACKQTTKLMLTDKTPEEIRKIFNLKNDFTPEEEDIIRKENEFIEGSELK